MTSPDFGRPITVGIADKQLATLIYAAEEARLSDCEIRLVHAYTVPPRPPQAMNLAYGFDIDGSFRESGHQVLADAVELLSSEYGDLVVRTVLEQGSAMTVLTGMSMSSRLMVLGPDDEMPWHSRLFVSRVSRKLVEEAPCPVVVVPDTWTARRPGNGVTLLLDSQTVGHGPLRYAFEQASRHQDVLRIVHIEAADGSHDESVPWHDMERLIESWRVSYPEVEVHTQAFAGQADLATVTSLEDSRLLVMGRPHADRITHPLPGLSLSRSLAQVVIDQADCPVAVVPARYDGAPGQGSAGG